MTAEQIAVLAHARPYRDGWRGPCPVHHGKSGTSFSIRRGERGVLLRCWGGCPTKEILAALGLRWADLFEGACPPRPALSPAVRRCQEEFRQHPAASRADDPLTVVLTDEEHAEVGIARALALVVEGKLAQIALEGATDGN